MSANNVERLIESKTICTMHDVWCMRTDRSVSWTEQIVVLEWQGNCNEGTISIVPDEAESLFTNSLLKNVAREEDGELYIMPQYIDKINFYEGAIICGIMAPRVRSNINQKIIDYAKKMGYISNEMTPVRMCSGIKSLISNADGTYSIFFKWDDTILKNIKREVIEEFTSHFNFNGDIKIKSDGVLVTGLSEEEVFSRENINIFTMYDFQLMFLNSEFDKRLLLRAVMQIAFIDVPGNILSYEMFRENGEIAIPEDKQEHIIFNEYGKKKLNCGTISYLNHYGNASYEYVVTAPYNEFIRELLVDMEEIIKAKYGIFVHFSRFAQKIYIRYDGEPISYEVEQDLISLDYAIRLVLMEKKVSRQHLYISIISLLEADSNGKFRSEFFSYLNTLQQAMPDKAKFM